MYICRLFHKDHPFEQIDARFIAEGQITIGRDPDADWPLTDADGTLSRLHCTISVSEGRLELSDTSTNGTFLDSGERAPRDAPVSLAVHDSIHLGAMTIVIDQATAGEGVDDIERTLVRLPVSSAPRPVASDWVDPAPAQALHRDASLIEAFCDGAKLDASALLAHDPVDLMKRAGAIYQQTVLGLAALMSERGRLKAELDLDRTTIRAEGNNPFKWTASRRLAQDLLSSTPEGFLSDAEAVRACFEDLSAHVAAVATGANSVANLLLDTFSPSAIAAEADERGFTLRGRAATCWEVHNKRHAELTRDGDDGPVRQAFVRAYAGDKASSD